MHRFAHRLALLSCCAALASAALAEPSRPECIAPAKPGGGFDLACQLAQAALADSKALQHPMRVVYLPGGVGAVAYNAIVTQRPDDANAIVAFSGGSLLNLAQGKFGKYNVDDVRWLAGIGTDYGMIAVRADAPYKTLKDLMAALKANPNQVVFGAGGTVGGQDWMKSALVVKKAGGDYRQMRYVAFEGGGETFTALLSGHVQAVSGDMGEAADLLEAGKIRVLAVLADKRLPGARASIPTAREQGYDLSWPTVRGFYVGPKVSDADYAFWEKAFKKAMATPEFARLRQSRDLYPFSLTGKELDAYVKKSVKEYRTLAAEFGLVK